MTNRPPTVLTRKNGARDVSSMSCIRKYEVRFVPVISFCCHGFGIANSARFANRWYSIASDCAPLRASAKLAGGAAILCWNLMSLSFADCPKTVTWKLGITPDSTPLLNFRLMGWLPLISTELVKGSVGSCSERIFKSMLYAGPSPGLRSNPSAAVMPLSWKPPSSMLILGIVNVVPTLKRMRSGNLLSITRLAIENFCVPDISSVAFLISMPSVPALKVPCSLPPATWMFNTCETVAVIALFGPILNVKVELMDCVSGRVTNTKACASTSRCSRLIVRVGVMRISDLPSWVYTTDEFNKVTAPDARSALYVPSINDTPPATNASCPFMVIAPVVEMATTLLLTLYHLPASP